MVGHREPRKFFWYETTPIIYSDWNVSGIVLTWKYSRPPSDKVGIVNSETVLIWNITNYLLRLKCVRHITYVKILWTIPIQKILKWCWTYLSQGFKFRPMQLIKFRLRTNEVADNDEVLEAMSVRTYLRPNGSLFIKTLVRYEKIWKKHWYLWNI